MKNWFNKLISRDDADLEMEVSNTTGQLPNKAIKQTLQPSSPLGTKKTSQPLEVLKRFSPLRNLDDQVLSQLPHKTLRYKAGSVIFRAGL